MRFASKWRSTGPSRSCSMSLPTSPASIYLSHAFHQHFGQTLSGYSRALRLFHAAELMRSKADLTAIAMDCGFFDQSHFTHAFQLQHQVSPGQYRRAMAEAELP